MTMIAGIFEAHVFPYQEAVPYKPAPATSGTYQATTYINRLHRFVFAQDVTVLAGTGASVTATAGEVWKAGVPYYWVPVAGRESLGWSAGATSSAVSGAIVASAAPHAG